MPDDAPQESSQEQTQELRTTERYYLNKRVDSIEVTMATGFQDLHEAIKESNAQTLAMFEKCQKNCKNEVTVVKNEVGAIRADVTVLTGYRNRAIGAVGIILLVLSIWRVG